MSVPFINWVMAHELWWDWLVFLIALLVQVTKKSHSNKLFMFLFLIMIRDDEGLADNQLNILEIA